MAGICGGDYSHAPILRNPSLCWVGGKVQAASYRGEKMSSLKKKRKVKKNKEMQTKRHNMIF